MKPACPDCGGNNIRYSRLRTPGERLAALIGRRPLRCRDCRARFTVFLWNLSNLPYARCPNCWNMTLGTWSPSHYRVSAGRGLLLFLGASSYRCEACRCNFVSFRRRKYRYKPSSRRETGKSSRPRQKTTASE